MDFDSSKETEKFKALAPILEDYTHWFSLISYAVAYPEQTQESIHIPTSFEEWLEKTQKDDSINQGVLRDLTDIYEQMVMDGRKILSGLKNGNKPLASEFNEFITLYNSYLRRVRRLEHDSAMEGSGIDQETGLRIPKAIKGDMKRELERLERHSTSFCQVMLRVDRFAGQPDQKESLKVAVDSIKKCMRPFDDAYYMGNGHFLISMKQTDLIGAEAGVNRLRMSLDQDENNLHKMTMSFCMVEPVVGDEADQMIKNMQQDLNDNLNAQDAVLKFKEVSDLERFIGTMN